MDVSRKEATERLKNGDAAFVLEAALPADYPGAIRRLETLSRVHRDAVFFAGLLTENGEASRAGNESSADGSGTLSGAGKSERSSLLFAAALKSASPPARAASAAKLILPCAEAEAGFVLEVLKRLGRRPDGGEISPVSNLRSVCLYRLGRFGELAEIYARPNAAKAENASPWEIIIPLLAALHGAEKTGNTNKTDETIKIPDEIKAFFFNFEDPARGVWEWALAETKRVKADFFNPGEEALLMGRAAVARSAYAEGLRFFRGITEEAALYPPEKYFFPYPELVSSLGRAFQFGSLRPAEGVSLFAGWSAALEGNPNPAFKTTGYRLLYFSGRIERQLGRYEASGDFFRAAIEAAPDGLQADACVWYLLMNSFADDPALTPGLFKEFIPRMSSPPYFTDVTDRLSRYLVNTRSWETMLEIFNLVKDREGHDAAASQFAWILGRAAEENLFETELEPEDFFKTAFEKEKAPLYYRAAGASALGLEFIPVSRGGVDAENSGSSSAGGKKLSPEIKAESQFILDFFEFNCGKFVLPYIEASLKSLPFSELRKAAKALAESGNRSGSLNLAARYMAREDYEPDIEDFLLYYPRHFTEIVESNAEKAGAKAELLFGLIRTESAFMENAVSRSDAAGLGQLMEATALEMAGRIARQGGPDYRKDGAVDLTDPAINVHISAYYLRYLTETLGSRMTAILAYNGGLGRVRRWRAAKAGLSEDLFLETIEFPETREYGRRVLAAAAMYGWLYYDMSIAAVFSDIYKEGFKEP